jgi:hypothetical protein
MHLLIHVPTYLLYQLASCRLTYDEVDADLALGPGLCQFEDLQLVFEAARLR